MLGDAPELKSLPSTTLNEVLFPYLETRNFVLSGAYLLLSKANQSQVKVRVRGLNKKNIIYPILTTIELCISSHVQKYKFKTFKNVHI